MYRPHTTGIPDLRTGKRLQTKKDPFNFNPFPIVKFPSIVDFLSHKSNPAPLALSPVEPTNLTVAVFRQSAQSPLDMLKSAQNPSQWCLGAL